MAHPVIKAVGFTGSLGGGKALARIAAERPVPIPFHGELGSVNPVVVTEKAAAERPDQIGQDLAGAVLLGAGQFCTKPGLLLVPEGKDGDRVVSALGTAITAAPVTPSTVNPAKGAAVGASVIGSLNRTRQRTSGAFVGDPSSGVISATVGGVKSIS